MWICFLSWEHPLAPSAQYMKYPSRTRRAHSTLGVWYSSNWEQTRNQHRGRHSFTEHLLSQASHSREPSYLQIRAWQTTSLGQSGGSRQTQQLSEYLGRQLKHHTISKHRYNPLDYWEVAHWQSGTINWSLGGKENPNRGFIRNRLWYTVSPLAGICSEKQVCTVDFILLWSQADTILTQEKTHPCKHAYIIIIPHGPLIRQ